MSALQLTMTYIETEDSLRGSCCWERHRQTSQFAKILAQCSVEVVDEAAKQRLRVKEKIHQARPWRHWAASEWRWYWRAGKHKGSRMKGGVFLGPARVTSRTRNDR